MYVQKGEIADFASAEEIEELKIYEHHNETKVRVHSTSQEGVLYNQVNVQIAENSITDLQINYFFLFTADNEGLESELKQVIHSLEFSGIGGQRSTGSGQFEGVEIRNFDFIEQKEAVQMSISLIIPKNKTLDNFRYFDFIERGGRRVGFNNPVEGSGFNLNRIKIIQEGAILNSDSEKGSIKDIKPKDEKGDSIFLRSGKAFLMPIHNKFYHNE